MTGKVFTVLENNPQVMNHLAHQLGVSPSLSFHDIYSLHDLASIPRPVYALLAIIPLTDTWQQSRLAEDDAQDWYRKAGPHEPVIWFQQTITHGCGSIGLLHCALNCPATAEAVKPGSDLERLLHAAIPLERAERARLLEDCEALYAAHQAAGEMGDTVAPTADQAERLGQHFVAFVKGGDGHLWELEGSRKGPLDRGVLGEEEDALSERALGLGLERLIKMEGAAGGDLRFSCLALGPRLS
ncbi:MAG: hypothetical protein Q9167_004164 [Letrouitia subvulpina]